MQELLANKLTVIDNAEDHQRSGDHLADDRRRRNPGPPIPVSPEVVATSRFPEQENVVPPYLVR